MNEIVKQFGNFLRYYLCGAIFVIAVLYSSRWLPPDLKNLKISDFLVLPLIPGAFIYSLHRNLLNPILEAIRGHIQGEGKWLVSKYEQKGLLFRWETDTDKYKAIPHLKIWGDHVQLLFSSGLAIVLAGAFTQFFDPRGRSGYEPSPAMFWLAFILYLAAMISDIRKQTMETIVRELPKSEPEA